MHENIGMSLFVDTFLGCGVRGMASGLILSLLVFSRPDRQDHDAFLISDIEKFVSWRITVVMLNERFV